MKLNADERDYLIELLSQQREGIARRLLARLNESDRDNPEPVDMFADEQDFGQKPDLSPYRKLF